MKTTESRKPMRVNLYLTQRRTELFQQAFELLKEQQHLPASAQLHGSRTTIVDLAFEALFRELERDEE